MAECRWKINFLETSSSCCTYDHKTVSVYVSSNITINKIVDNDVIKMYRSALQSVMWSSCNSRPLPPVNPKSYLLFEVLNTTDPDTLPSILTYTALQTSRQNLHVARSKSCMPFTSYLCLDGNSSCVKGNLRYCSLTRRNPSVQRGYVTFTHILVRRINGGFRDVQGLY